MSRAEERTQLAAEQRDRDREIGITEIARACDRYYAAHRHFPWERRGQIAEGLYDSGLRLLYPTNVGTCVECGEPWPCEATGVLRSIGRWLRA
jgi:hypothetical protein